MKILIVSQYFWPESFRINDMADALKADYGHEVTVLTGMPNYPGGEFFAGYSLTGPFMQTWQGINIIRAPLLSRGKNSRVRLALNYLSYALTASIVAVWKCREHYDVILVSQYSPVTVALPAILIKKRKKTPMFLWVQDLWPESMLATGAVNSPTILKIVETLVAYIYRQSDRVLVQSKAFIPRIRALGREMMDIDYLPNWAEAVYIPRVPEVVWGENKGLPSGFRVMFAGNIGEAQDFATILSAAELLRNYADIHWIVLGDGSARSWVEREIERKKLTASLHLLGAFPMEEMPRFFALADALLVTLKKEPIFALTIPSKIQSYMACARPILAALDGEGRGVIDESAAGLSCGAEDPEQLAAIVLQLYNMTSQEREAMGIRGRKYYEQHYDRKRLIENLNKLFEQVQVKKEG